MKSFYQEFKNFAIKSNMIDMAIGIVIGTACNNVISTIVKTVIMPPLSMLTEGVNLSDMKYILHEATVAKDEVAIGYGELLEALIDFFIIAFTIFVIVKFLISFRIRGEFRKNKTFERLKKIQ